ncbi:hypothetical protein Ccrd_009877 [Cynara cardunculus var. scolymus]|uniref:Uncharacterized protein n=1 Tax=Cynara cardunculus var. scolymus TaxID=59895 RepID=A0A103YM50_CYNCS|nr:hypothetical protein Ccrd_009877 [Cynara cardunculus var. scolymus]
MQNVILWVLMYLLARSLKILFLHLTIVMFLMSLVQIINLLISLKMVL